MIPFRKTARPVKPLSRLVAPVCRTSLVCAAVALTLAGCGGGSGDGDGKTSVSDVTAGDTSAAADNVATETLQRNASANASKALSGGIGGLSSLNQGSGAASGLTNALGGLSGSSDGDTTGSTTGAPGGDDDNLLVDEDAFGEADGNVKRLFDAMLGNQGADAVSTRSGNTVTINPDEREICAGEVYLINAGDDKAACENLVSQMTVNLNAATEESGEMTVLFNTDALLDVAYGPSKAVYELNLDTLQLVMQNAEQFSGETALASMTLAGSVRLASSINDDAAGSASGEASLEITRALKLSNGDNVNLSLAPSTLLKIVGDEATGTSSMFIGLDAMQLTLPADSLPDDDDDDGLVLPGGFDPTPDTGLQGMGSRLMTLAMSGLTARIDVKKEGNQVSFSNIGLGNGPLTLTIDQVEALRLTMSTFGLDIDGTTGVLTLNGNLDIALAANNLMGFLGNDSDQNDSVDLRISAPNGTSFGQSQAGGLKVTAVGPVSVNATVVSDGTSSNQSVVVNAGQCIESPAEGSADAILTAVACD